MIYLRHLDDSAPRYMSAHSAGCDLKATAPVLLEPMQRVLVPCGVWIDNVNWELVPEGFVPELQVRARSGLAIKHGITLINGVGTIDADYREEIKAPLINLGSETFEITAGMRIVQLCLNLVRQIPKVEVGGETRLGGFGSTGA